MLDMHFLSKKDMTKYNLQKDVNDLGCDKGASFIRIKDSEWIVLGIDEKQDILYVANDGDGIFHNLDGYSIDDLEENDYILLGRQKEYISGMISTRNIADPVDDVKNFIDMGVVYKVKYIGVCSIVYNKLDGYLDDKCEICYKKLEE